MFLIEVEIGGGGVVVSSWLISEAGGRILKTNRELMNLPVEVFYASWRE